MPDVPDVPDAALWKRLGNLDKKNRDSRNKEDLENDWRGS